MSLEATFLVGWSLFVGYVKLSDPTCCIPNDTLGQCESHPSEMLPNFLPLFHKKFSGKNPCVSLPQQRDRDEFVGIVMLAPSAQQARFERGAWHSATGFGVRGIWGVEV